MYAQAFSMLVDGNKHKTAQSARPLPPPTPPPRPPPPPAQAGSHETCTFPDCKFFGNKKSVNTHYTSTHGMYSGSGIKSIVVEGKSFGVLLGDDPEEVRLWREQRRSKFPTTINTQQKLDTNHNIQLLGGIIGHDNNTTKSNVNKTTSSSSSSGTHTSTTKSTTAVCKTFVRIGKCKYGKRCRYIHDSAPTGPSNPTAGPLNTAPPPNSTSDSATNTTAEQTSTTADSATNNTATDGTDQSPGKLQKPPHKVRNTHKSSGGPTSSGAVKRQRISYHTNLLERLLDDEIVYEDNMILQCIRYLCVNKLNKTSS